MIVVSKSTTLDNFALPSNPLPSLLIVIAEPPLVLDSVTLLVETLCMKYIALSGEGIPVGTVPATVKNTLSPTANLLPSDTVKSLSAFVTADIV